MYFVLVDELEILEDTARSWRRHLGSWISRESS